MSLLGFTPDKTLLTNFAVREDDSVIVEEIVRRIKRHGGSEQEARELLQETADLLKVMDEIESQYSLEKKPEATSGQRKEYCGKIETLRKMMKGETSPEPCAA